jgi:flagellar biosynthesis protein FlhA
LQVLTLEPRLQQSLLESARPLDHGIALLPGPELVESLITSVAAQYQAAQEKGIRPVLVCAPQIRLPLRRLIATSSIDLPVMSYSEISSNATIVDTVGVISDGRAVAVGGR